jgi:hypothetical protein
VAEFWRRWCLLAGLCAGVCLFHYAALGTYASLERADFAGEQKNPRGSSLRTELEDYRAGLPLDEYVETVTAGARLSVSGPAFEALFADVDAALAGAARPEFARRIRADERGWRLPLAVWYRADEAPLDSLDLETGPLVRWLVLGQESSGRWLKLVRRPVTIETFAPFFGFSGYAPPGEMLYPYRTRAWLPAALGLVLYLLVPWPRRPENGMSAGRVRVVVADFAWPLVFLPFFWLPFILGGPVQSFAAWWWVGLLGWSFALFALLLLRYIAWFAGFSVAPTPEGLRVRSWGEAALLRYAELKRLRPALLTSPRWLTRLYAILLPFAGGAGGVRLAGVTMMLDSASNLGWLFDLADGRTIALWWGDQFGNPTFKGFEKIRAALALAGFAAEGEPVVRRGFGGEFRPGPTIPSPGRRAWLLAAATPLLLVAGFVLAAALSAPPPLPPAPVQAVSGPDRSLPALPAAAVRFDRTLLSGQAARGVRVLPAGDGYTLLGTAEGQEGWRAEVLLTDDTGEVRWSRRLGGEYADQGGTSAGVELLSAPDGGFAVLSESLSANRLSGAADVARLDAGGAVVWETSLGYEAGLVTPVAMARSDDYWTVLVHDQKNMLDEGREGYYLVSLDEAGRVAFESEVKTGREEPVLRAMLRDGRGFLLVGESRRKGGFVDGLAVRVDLKGGTVAVRDVGDQEKETFAAVCPAPGGGAWLVGGVGLGAQADALVVSLDEHDAVRWQRRLGGADEDAAVAVVPRGEGLAVLCHSRAADGSSYALVAGLSPAGSIDFLYTIGASGGQVEPEAFSATSGGYVLTGARPGQTPAWFWARLSPE